MSILKNMIAKASGRFLRISHKKVSQFIYLLRGKPVNIALALLNTQNKGARQYLLKILNSDISNAKLKGFNIEQLYISKILADKGPTWKRFRAVAFGRATEIKKRTSHIRIELDLLNTVRKKFSNGVNTGSSVLPSKPKQAQLKKKVARGANGTKG